MSTKDGRRECRKCGGVNACHDDCPDGGEPARKRIEEAEKAKRDKEDKENAA